MRVLDLGCGSGGDLASWGVTAADGVTGLDIDDSRLAIAKVRFSNRTYLQGAGECLPSRMRVLIANLRVCSPPHEHSENAGRNSSHSRS